MKTNTMISKSAKKKTRLKILIKMAQVCSSEKKNHTKYFEVVLMKQ